MINSIEELKSIYGNLVIVNYDMKDVFDYGVTYRTTTESLEKFRKYNGEYIRYPYIQPYLSLNNNKYSLLIIKENRIYKLKKGFNKNTYNIDCEINVDVNIFKDVFYSKSIIKKPANRANEPIYIIEGE